MKKILMAVCVMTLVLGMAGLAGATPVTFTDVTTFTASGTDSAEDYVNHGRGDVNKLDGILDYVRWTHHFDFNPELDYVISANLTLSLRDDEDFRLFGVDMEAEIGGGWIESGDWDLGEIDTGDYTYDIDVAYLGDGEFTVTLGSVIGDFYIDESALEITYEPVPEPGTILLLGSGLLGLMAYGRRKKLLKK